jgi:hypothetical protein
MIPSLDISDPMTKLTKIAALSEGWDREGAAPPDNEAIGRAARTVAWAWKQGFQVDDVDADVLGGVAVFIRTGERSVWISIMNGGQGGALFSVRGEVQAHDPFAPSELLPCVAAFLHGTSA